jgi:hypothetical protein
VPKLWKRQGNGSGVGDGPTVGTAVGTCVGDMRVPPAVGIGVGTEGVGVERSGVAVGGASVGIAVGTAVGWTTGTCVAVGAAGGTGVFVGAAAGGWVAVGAGADGVGEPPAGPTTRTVHSICRRSPLPAKFAITSYSSVRPLEFGTVWALKRTELPS